MVHGIVNPLQGAIPRSVLRDGMGEAYMPLLEALERLCREPQGQDLLDLLKRYAPNWPLHMSGLLDPDDIQSLRRATLGVTPQRMLREIATALEVFTAARPLVLVLEDLHWSDDATLQVLLALARRQEPARFLLLGTYRPEEVKGQKSLLYSIVQDLRLRKCCETL